MQAEKEYVRKNILAAATPLFYAKGYVKVPMRKIAEASHVGLSNIYNYYDSKEDIFHEIVRPVVNCFYEMLDEHHGKRGADILEMFTNDYLRSVIDEYVSIVNKYRDLLFLLLHSIACRKHRCFFAVCCGDRHSRICRFYRCNIFGSFIQFYNYICG